MVFPLAAAAAAAYSYQKPLGGFYHPPLKWKPGDLEADALTVALDVYQAWAVFLALSFTIIVFAFLAFCICSKRDDGYGEFEITHGITTVKICRDRAENGVSLLPRINGSGTGSLKATDETSEASSRYTLKRELPAIPTSDSQSTEKMLDSRTDRPASQHSSDLYASVNDPSQVGGSIKPIGGVQVLPAVAIAPGGRAAVGKDSMTSPDKDQIENKDGGKMRSDGFGLMQKGQSINQPRQPKKEHPYAKVGHISGQDKVGYDEPKILFEDFRKKQSDTRASLASSSQRTETATALLSISQTSADKKSGGATSPHSPGLAASIHSTFSTHSSSVVSPTAAPHARTSIVAPPTSPVEIPAAMAITGRTPANEEMPYMTPSSLQQSERQQQHFSGDSQDSRGYTSISVREPLAALKARQATEKIASSATTQGPTSANGEGYYMTVSDDSADETYACIYEGGSRGTGSETYAQIEPRTTQAQPTPSVTSPSAPTAASATSPTRAQDSPPAPPSVDSLRHVVHSRQASAGSATSTGMSSPVSEKRGARSPLPPVPQGESDMYATAAEPPSPSHHPPKSPTKASAVVEKPTPRSLEEMYAKVIKKGPGHSRGCSSGGGESDNGGSVSSSRRGSADVGRLSATSPSSAKSPPEASVTHSLLESHHQETQTQIVVAANRTTKPCDISASWSGVGSDKAPPLNLSSSAYETIPHQGDTFYSGGSSDPGYETVKNGDPHYASVDQRENYPGYETVNRGASDLESEPGYETLQRVSAPHEPEYERVTHSSHAPDEDEPGYETVASKELSTDPGYESVLTEREGYDPGYEELSHPYHPRSVSESDPNYEPLKFATASPGPDSTYQSINKELEGNYDLVSNYETQSKDYPIGQIGVRAKEDNVMPLYASVQKKRSPKKECSTLLFFGDPKNDNANVVEPPKFEPITADLLEDFCSSIIPKDQEGKIKSDDNGAKSNSETDSLKVALGSPEVLKEELLSFTDSKDGSPRKIDDFPVFSSDTPGKEYRSDDKSASTTGKAIELMDSSPEEVELPPPGEGGALSPPLLGSATVYDDAKTIKDDNSLSTAKVVSSSIKADPLVSFTFTSASPASDSPETSSQKSTESASSVIKECGGAKTDGGSVKCGDKGCPDGSKGCPPGASDCGTEHGCSFTEEVLPPPPSFPRLEDVIVASPPPPPPLHVEDAINLQELPPPPFGQGEEEHSLLDLSATEVSAVNSLPEGVVNGLEVLPIVGRVSPAGSQRTASPEQASSASSDFPLPPPPPPLSTSEEEKDDDDDDDLDRSVSSAYQKNLNGCITVTVNPMAAIEDVGSQPQCQTVQGEPPSSPPSASQGTNGTSSVDGHSSSSTTNGSCSVESMVTVDVKTGADPSISSVVSAPVAAPVAAPAPTSTPILQHSSSTSSSSSATESKHSEANEGVTSV